MSTIIFFLKDFDYTPSNDPYITYAYKVGGPVEVDDECADRAVAGGFANYPDTLEDDLFESVEDESADEDE
jgi:hypothetical protein